MIFPELALIRRALGSFRRPGGLCAQNSHVLVDKRDLARFYVLFEQDRLHEPEELPAVWSLKVAELDDGHARILVARAIGLTHGKSLLSSWWVRVAAFWLRAARIRAACL